MLCEVARGLPRILFEAHHQDYSLRVLTSAAHRCGGCKKDCVNDVDRKREE